MSLGYYKYILIISLTLGNLLSILLAKKPYSIKKFFFVDLGCHIWFFYKGILIGSRFEFHCTYISAQA
jgi:hypothetical protein